MASEKKIKVLFLEVQKEPVVLEIDTGLEAMQKLVGGYIECVPLNDHGLDLVCNEEGKLKQNPEWNRTLRMQGKIYDIACGNCFVAKFNAEGEAVSLSDKEIAAQTDFWSLAKSDGSLPEVLRLMQGMGY